MQTALWLFLHVESETIRVLQWFVSRGENDNINLIEAGEGDPKPATEKIERTIMVLPSAKVLLTQVRLPPNVRATEQSLGYALEDRLAQDPSEILIRVLEEPQDRSGQFAVAVWDRKLQRLIAEAALDWQITRYALTPDSLLLPLEQDTWSLWYSPTRCFARIHPKLGLELPLGSEAMILRQYWTKSLEEGRAPKKINIYGDKAHEDWAMKAVQDWAVPLPLQFNRANVTTFMRTAFIDLHPSDYALWWREFWDRWIVRDRALFKPLFALALSVVGVIGVQTIQWAREAQQLENKIQSNFHKIFGKEAVQTFDPIAQMEKRVRQHKGAMQNGSLSHAMGQVLRATQNQSGNEALAPPIALEWKNETLTLSFQQNIPVSVVSTIQNLAPEKTVLANAQQMIIGKKQP